MPCPFALSWIVDNPIRRWEVRHALTRAGLRAGETVLELGPGPGAFTLEAVQRVGPDGKVIAVDIQPEMIAQVQARVQAAGATNVETHRAVRELVVLHTQLPQARYKQSSSITCESSNSMYDNVRMPILHSTNGR
ncbi:MAG: methyltransferase domain-containing protein [Anaerolineae bacterium]|nr:methyltransferase domain-containing protein [Anaerolineae bacterium]